MSATLWLVAISLTTGERRFLPVGPKARLVGRSSNQDQDGPDKLCIDFDPSLSRSHFVAWSEPDGIHIRRDGNRHPLFFRGVERTEFILEPGEHFSTGQTRFEYRAEGASLQPEVPVAARTMNTMEREQALEHDSVRCLHVLLEMQTLLGTAAPTEILFSRLVPLIARVVPNASLVMIIAVDGGDDYETIAAYGDLPPHRPTRTLVRAALETGEPVFHIFQERMDPTALSPTITAGVGWVLAAPILPSQGPAWILYTVGRDAYTDARVDALPGEVDRAVLSLVARVLTQFFEGRRAVALQLQIQAERQQRALSEALRDLANDLTSTLELGDVLERLLTSIQRVVPFARAVGMLRREQDLEAAAIRGNVDPASVPVIPTGEPVLVEFEVEGRGVILDPGRLEALRLGAGWRESSVLCVPILWSRSESPGGRQLRGLLVLARGREVPFLAGEVETASLFASQAAIAFRNAALFERVQRLATTDELTSAYNRRHFLEWAGRLAQRAMQGGRPLHALMLDVDHFKRFNDTYGHSVGDQVLRYVAQTCMAQVRPEDIFGRLGGEEFAILLQCEQAEAMTVAERIRVAVQAPLLVDGRSLSVTISGGLASVGKEKGASAEAVVTRMLHEADVALYAAKQAGRNRVQQA